MKQNLNITYMGMFLYINELLFRNASHHFRSNTVKYEICTDTNAANENI